jgi:hypothetical protein
LSLHLGIKEKKKLISLELAKHSMRKKQEVSPELAFKQLKKK